MFINQYAASELLPEAESREAESYYQKKDYVKAKEKYTGILAKYPDAQERDRYLYGLSWVLLQTWGHAGGRGELRKAGGRVSGFGNLAVTACMQLGEARARMKNYEQAADAYKRALAKAKDPADIKTARYDLAWAYYQAKMFKEAEQALVEMMGSIRVRNRG